MLPVHQEKCSGECACACEAGQKVRAFVDTATTAIQETKAQLADHIRRDPIGSCALIASVAYALGKLARQR